MSITEYGCHNSKCTQGLPLCNGAASIKEGRPDGAAAINELIVSEMSIFSRGVFPPAPGNFRMVRCTTSSHFPAIRAISSGAFHPTKVDGRNFLNPNA